MSETRETLELKDGTFVELTDIYGDVVTITFPTKEKARGYFANMVMLEGAKK